SGDWSSDVCSSDLDCEQRQAVLFFQCGASPPPRICPVANFELAIFQCATCKVAPQFEMKWRNQLLALFCLLVFAGLGVLYFQHWVVQKPFGIILFIGEGLAPDRLAATRLYVGGADARLTVDSMNHAALLINYLKDFAVP